jgi:hypothetical protein
MLLNTIFSGALLVLPVAVTGGIYVGVEYQRILNLWNGGTGRVGRDGLPIITTKKLCDKQDGYMPFPGRYLCEFWIPSSFFSLPTTTGNSSFGHGAAIPIAVDDLPDSCVNLRSDLPSNSIPGLVALLELGFPSPSGAFQGSGQHSHAGRSRIIH